MNKNIITIGIIILTSLLPHTSIGQSNYISGYIINSESDTIDGFIDYRNWAKNPLEIQFKTDTQSTSANYSPSEINGFGAMNEIYVSGVVELFDKSEYDESSSKTLFKTKTDTVFLQALVMGEKSLFHFQNSNGVNFFYILQDSSYNLLIYRKFTKHTDQGNVVKENNKYLGQLNLYLYDCETIFSKLEKTSYDKQNLTKLFSYYYSHSNAEITYNKNVEKIQTKIGVLVGGSRSALWFKSPNNFQTLVSTGFSSSLDFSGGVSFEFVLPRNRRKWSIYTDLIYTSYDVSGVTDHTGFETTSNFKNSYIKLNTMIKYTIPIKGISLFLNGGMSNGIAVYQSDSYTTKFRKYSSPVFDETRPHEQGIIIGTGLIYKKFSLDLRSEWSNGFSVYSDLKSYIQRTYVYLGFVF
jgi:hypothetical protein